jgi:hypothetical protein
MSTKTAEGRPAGVEGARETIEAEVTSWPGVEATGIGKRGEYGFAIGRRQIGHLHGDRVAHFAFPKSEWAELLEAGRIERHPVDRPGLAARALRSDDDVADAIALMRINYDRAIADGDR